MNQPPVPKTRAEKEQERCDLLCETASYVCESLTKSSGERFYFHRSDLADVASAYFDAVERLRTDNGMKSLINRPKIAALTIQEILRHRPIKAHENVPDTVHLVMANSWYAYVVALDLMKIDMSHVDDDVAEEIQFLIHVKVGSGECDTRTLMLVMDLLGRSCQSPAGRQSWWRRIWYRLTGRAWDRVSG